MIIFNIFFPDFGGDSEGGGDDEGGGDETKTPKVGDYYFVKDSRGGKYYILQSDGGFKKVNRKPTTGNQFSKSDFNPVIENIKNNQNNSLGGGGEDDIGGGETIDDNTSAFLNFNVENQNKNKFNNIFNSASTVAYNTSGLEGRNDVTYIDMRKKINESTQGGSGINGANTELVDNIPEFDPSRSSIYEAFVSA